MTTEDITRRLRARDADPKDVAATAAAVIGGNSVWLPNAPQFVLDLLCDRLKEPHWRNTAEIWRLFTLAWTNCDSSRSRSLRRVRIVETATAVLRDAPTLETANALFAALDLVVSEYIEIEETALVGFVAAFAALLQSVDILPHSGLVLRLDEIAKQLHMYKMSKKVLAKYHQEALAPVLTLLARGVDPKTEHVLHAINTFYLFSDASALKSCISKHLKNVPDSALVYLLRETIDKLGATDIAACEHLYVEITKIRESLAEPLLELLAGVNKNFTPGFFGSLYEKADWRIRARLVTLSPDLALKKWTDFVGIDTDVPFVASCLMQGFAKARELSMFIREVYPAASRTPEWALEPVRAALAPHLDLTTGQISRFIKEHMEKGNRSTVLLLLSVDASKRKGVPDVAIPQWSDVALALLDILGTLYLERHPEIRDIDDLTLQLRISELSGEETAEKKLAKHVKELSVDELFVFFRRWMVLTDPMKKVQNAFFKRVDKLGTYAEFAAFLHKEGLVLYELEKFAARLALYCEKSPNLRNAAIPALPKEVYRMHFTELGASVVSELLDKPNTELILCARAIVNSAPLLTVVGKQLDALRKMASIDEESAAVVWLAHVTAHKDEASRRFILSALEGDCDFPFSHVIVSGPVPDDSTIQDLHTRFCNGYVKEVVKKPYNAAYFANLPKLSAESRRLLLSYAKEHGKTADEAKRNTLFELVCKCHENPVFATALYVALSQTQDVSVGPLAFAYDLDDDAFCSIYQHVVDSLGLNEQLLRCLTILAPKLSPKHEHHKSLFVGGLVALAESPFMETPAFAAHLAVLATMMNTHQWIVTAYTMEALFVLASRVLRHALQATYCLAAKIVGILVGHHRFFLGRRYHLLVALLTSFMSRLCGDSLVASPTTAIAFQRLVAAVCEPAQRHSQKDALTTSVDKYKRVLRRHVHVVVANYIHMQLGALFAAGVDEHVRAAVLGALSLLTRRERGVLAATLDGLGQALFQTLTCH